MQFKFKPFQHVIVTAYGLNYAGRVQWCKWDGQSRIYHVEYAQDGDLKGQEFYEDELHERTPD